MDDRTEKLEKLEKLEAYFDWRYREKKILNLLISQP